MKRYTLQYNLIEESELWIRTAATTTAAAAAVVFADVNKSTSVLVSESQCRIVASLQGQVANMDLGRMWSFSWLLSLFLVLFSVKALTC